MRVACSAVGWGYFADRNRGPGTSRGPVLHIQVGRYVIKPVRCWLDCIITNFGEGWERQSKRVRVDWQFPYNYIIFFVGNNHPQRFFLSRKHIKEVEYVRHVTANTRSRVCKQCTGQANPREFKCKTVENTINLFCLDLCTRITYWNDIYIKF